MAHGAGLIGNVTAGFLLCLLGACQIPHPATTAATVTIEQPQAERAWQGIIRPEDNTRLQGLATAWSRGLDAARRGFARRIAAEGDLLDPAAALPRALLPPGSYRCRTITLGSRQAAFRVQGPHFCYVGVEGELISFTKQTGPDRPGGYLYADGDTRSVFIGAAATGRERVPPAYGANPARDVVGVVERVGPFRYRLVVPAPRNGAALEIYELVPAVG